MTEIYLACCVVLLGIMSGCSYLLFEKLILIRKENSELKRQLRKWELDAWQRESHTVEDMFLE